MGAESNIGWTDASWTPIRARNKATGKRGWHCRKISAGCDGCYSSELNERLGTGLPFKPGHEKDIEVFLDEKMLLAPLSWKKPRKIFVCSMTDLFLEFHSDEWIDKVFAVMALCPQHTFQILTKRSKRMREYMINLVMMRTRMQNASLTFGMGYNCIPVRIAMPLSNVWLGVSAEDQARYDERKLDLMKTPAAIKFMSMEPLLGCVQMDWLPDWVIVGGESGKGHRPMKMEWAEKIMLRCQEEGDTALFFKQDSAHKPGQRGRASDELWACKQFPEVNT